VGLQRLAGYGPRPSGIGEYPFIGAEVDVEVVEGTAPDPGAEDYVKLSESGVLDKSVGTTLLPEGFAGHLADGPRKVGAIPSATPLQYGHRPTRFSQTASHHRPAKTGSDDDHVVSSRRRQVPSYLGVLVFDRRGYPVAARTDRQTTI
jgi:hypothetical protein